MAPSIFDVRVRPKTSDQAVEIFLNLEASGWKAKRGTALMQGRRRCRLCPARRYPLAETGQCEIVTLPPAIRRSRPRRAPASDRRVYFKLGVDERFAKTVARGAANARSDAAFCADPAIAMADSTQAPITR